MPLILPGNVASATAATTYEIANSCRFDAASSSKMSKAVSTSGSNTKFTISFWMKPSKYNAYQRLFWGGVGSGNETGITLYAQGRDDASDAVLSVYLLGSSSARSWLTERAFRDYSSWYHIFVRVDTTDSTAADRIQLYVNGVRETDFSESSNPGENETFDLFHSNNLTIGMEQDSGDRFPYNGYLAEFVVLDGTAAAVTDLGEFDEDSPNIWKPKDPSGLSFGTSGFWLDFEASDNLGNDANGGTDLSETNIAAVDQSVDTPTNNACTLNPLAVATSSALAFSEGNNKIYNSASSWRPAFGTFPVSTGKWYYEVKGLLFPGTSYIQIGWVSLEYTENGNAALTDEIAGWGNTDPAAIYDSRLGKVYWQNVTTNGNTAYGDSYTAGDVIGVALDLDNDNIYFAEDNTWKNSGDPTSGATGTGAFSIVAGHTWVPFIGLNNATAEATFASPVQANSSDAADGNERGQFEFAPPSGYLSLCSKNTA